MTRSRRSFVIPWCLALACLAWSAAPAQEPPAGAAPGDTAAVLAPKSGPVDVVSPHGDFRITFPSGCGRLMQRSNFDEEAGRAEADMEIYYYACDRNGRKGAGCSIKAVRGVTERPGGQARPGQVIDEVKKQMRVFGVSLQEQMPVRRSFGARGTAEGVVVRGLSNDGRGTMRVMGLAYRDNVYVLACWNDAGDVDADPEYSAFFASFLPFVE